MPTFQFMKLPLIAQKRVLTLSELRDLVFLSFCSTKLLKILKYSNPTKEKVLPSIYCYSDTFYMTLTGPGWGEMIWDFEPLVAKNGEKYQEQGEKRDGEVFIDGVLTVGGFKMDYFVSSLESDFVSAYGPITLELMRAVENYLFDIFPATQYQQILVDVSSTGDVRQFFDKLLKKKTNQLGFQESPIETSDLEYTLDVMDCRNIISIGNGVSGDVNSQKIMELDMLQMFKSKWMNREHLLNWDFEFADVSNVVFGTTDIVDFVNQWLNGNNTKKRVLFCSLDESCEPWDCRLLRNEFPTLPFDKDRRGATYDLLDGVNIEECKEWRVYCCKDHWDIERRDGLLASVFFGPRAFRFLVWHQRFFPNIPND